MLFYKTIDSGTLELLKNLLGIDAFKNLRLVGGTALALQIGHRKSVDLDLFGDVILDETVFSETLSGLDKYIWLKKTPSINIFSIQDIKVDFVKYTYPWLEKINTTDGLRLAGLSDIAAMKLAAITGRGSKKDFIDIYFLLQYFSLQQMLEFYKKKYADGSEFLVLKSIIYFDDAEKELSPDMLIKIDWADIKSHILKKHKEYLAGL